MKQRTKYSEHLVKIQKLNTNDMTINQISKISGVPFSSTWAILKKYRIPYKTQKLKITDNETAVIKQIRTQLEKGKAKSISWLAVKLNINPVVVCTALSKMLDVAEEDDGSIFLVNWNDK